MTPEEKVKLLARQIIAKKKAELRGLGDVVAKVTKAVGVKPCAPCQERRERLNALFPFKKG